VGAGVLTEGFPRVAGTLHAEGVPLASVADAVGTPAWVYSAGTIRAQVERLRAALGDVPVQVHYAVKANGTLGVLRELRALGIGADVVSAGELHRARLAGFDGASIIMDGPAKTRDAIAADVAALNVESRGEIDLVAEAAARLGRVARVGLRVNPEVSVENFHRYIATGEEGDKFGIPYDEALACAEAVLAAPSLALVGLHMHVGSQLDTFEAFEAGIGKLAVLIDRLRSRPGGVPSLRFLDIGGGLPMPYAPGDAAPDLAGYGAVVRRAHERTGCTIVLEPGRLLVAAAGVLLTRVLYRKRSGGRDWVLVDAGMSELIRPALYEAWHAVEPVAPRADAPATTVDVAGPICESADVLALGRSLPDPQPGDLLAIGTAGAYGSVMSSNYNARPRAAEVLVDGDRWAVVRARETLDDLVRHEAVAPDWRTAR
jgi:diaminopimelate decarboxylase